MRKAWLLGFSLLALLPSARASASPNPSLTPPASVHVLGVERTEDRVRIRLGADVVTGAMPSEPFHLGGGRTRVFITLQNAVLIAPFDSIVPGAGMLALRADGYNGNVRITADVAGLADYGVEQTPEGLDLWLDLERPASAAAAPAAAPITLRNRMTAYAAEARAAILAGMARLGTLDWRATVSPARVAILVTLLLLPLAAWRLFQSAAPRSPEAERAVDAAPARIRAARALAADGLRADEIARRTGISRDVATLIVRRPGPAKDAGSGTSFRGRWLSPRGRGKT